MQQGGLPGHLFLISGSEPEHSAGPLATAFATFAAHAFEDRSTLIGTDGCTHRREDVALRLRVPSAIVSDWLSGKSALPDITVLALIALMDETNDS